MPTVEQLQQRRQQQVQRQKQMRGDYTFNGVTYSNDEDYNNAKKQFTEKFTKLAYLDYLNSGSNMQAFQQNLSNKQGFAFMSDHEWNYITKQASNNASPSAYTKSATDQYLSQIGLPSIKDLSKYHSQYSQYMSSGGILDNYSDMTTEEYDYIKKKFSEDYHPGLNGNGMFNAKGDELKYDDTYLDSQLQANGLPSAKQMEVYHAQYLKEKADAEAAKAEKEAKQAEHDATQARIDRLYEDAYAKVDMSELDKGDPSTYHERYSQALKKALDETLQLPAYSDLYQYHQEIMDVPSMDDQQYQGEFGSPYYNQYDPTSKYESDYDKAMKNNAAVANSEFNISTNGMENYLAKKTADARNAARSQKYTEIAENNINIVNTPATTTAEKQKQWDKLEEYLRAYGGKYSASDFTWYVGAVNAGVPADVCQQGVGAVQQWVNENYANEPSKRAEIDTALLGYNVYNGVTEDVQSALTTTNAITATPSYDRHSKYNPALYEKEVDDSGDGVSVTTKGAIYALVNGQNVTANLSDFLDSEYAELYRLMKGGIGTVPLRSLMTEEQRGTFNYLYGAHSRDPKQAMEYLYQLSFLLEDEAANAGTQAFSNGMRAGMSDADVSKYVYDMNDYEYGRRLLSIDDNSPDAWMKDAWKKYSHYTDEQLEYLLSSNENWKTAEKGNGSEPLTPGYIPGEEDEQNEANLANYEMVRAINFVLSTRKDLHFSADMAGYMQTYKEDEGKANSKVVTDTLKDNNGVYIDNNGVESKYAGSINGIGHASGEQYGLYQLHPDMDDPEYTRAELQNRDIANSMTEDERNRFNWLLVHKGAEIADAYFEGIRNELDVRSSSEITESNKQWAKEHPVLATIESNLAFPVAGVNAVVGTLENLFSGTDLTRTQAAQWDFTNEWREGVSEDMSGLGSFAYNTMMSMFDSGAAAGMNAALPGLGEIMLASSAYAGTLRSSIDRGLNPLQATATATIAGLAEYVTEKIGLETLVEGVKSLGKGAVRSVGKQAIINTAKQAIYEGSEEFASDVINLVADTLINGDFSEFNQEVDNYRRQGMTQEEAERLAWRNWWVDAGLSAAGGMVSGGIMAGAGNLGGVALHGLEIRGLGDQRAAVGNERHVGSYINGRNAVTKIFGGDTTFQVQDFLGTKETFGISQNIDGINELFDSNKDKSAYWYRYVYDVNGNVALSNDERIALASALAVNGAEANSNSIDGVIARMQADRQSPSQRRAFTNSKNIMDSAQFQEAQNQIDNSKADIKSVVDEVNETTGHLNDVTARHQATTQKLGELMLYAQNGINIYDSKIEALNTRLSALTTELNNTRLKLQGINADDRIARHQQNIQRNQELIDKHWASLANMLDYASNTSSVYNQQTLENARARIQKVGQSIDSNLDGTNEQELEDLRNQQVEAEKDLRKSEKAVSENSSGESDAILAAKRGEAQEWLKERKATTEQRARAEIQARQEQGRADAQARKNTQTQASKNANAQNQQAQNQQNQQTQDATRDERTAEDELPPLPDEAPAENAQQNNAPTAANSEQTSQASNSTAEGANAENTASENATEQTQEVKKTTYNIGKKVQQKFNRIAERFGCKIVWESRENIHGNGYYDSSKPNEIHLATDMLAKEGISSEMVVAREFFVHEITHFVSNTKAYATLSRLANDYFTKKYGADTVKQCLNGIIKEEAEYGHEVDMAYAVEEMTAQFAQDVLFGDEQSLNWLTRTNMGAVSDMLTWVEYLIKRGNARKMKDGAATKTLLLDAEYALAKAIEERQYLDKAGIKSAYLSSDQIINNAKKSADILEREQAERRTSAQERTQEQAQEQAQTETPVQENAQTQTQLENETQPQVTETENTQSQVEETPIDRNGSLNAAENEADKYDRMVQNGEMNEDGSEIGEIEELTPEEQAEEQARLAEEQSAEPVTLTEQQTRQAGTIANRLSAGNNIVLRIPTDGNYHAVAELIQNEVLDKMPEAKRDGVSIISTLNADNIQRTLSEEGTHLIITADSVNKVGGNATWFNLLGGNTTSQTQNAGAQAFQRDLLTRSSGSEANATQSSEDAYADAFMESGTKAYSRNGDTFEKYLTPEAREKYSKDGRYVHENFAHPELAFITAASWDNVNIPADVLLQIPEIAEAQARIDSVGKRNFSEDYPTGKNAEMDAKRRSWVSKLQDAEHGSAVYENGKLKKDGKGNAVYTGEVAQDKVACIVVGRPAAGKSSVFADPLSNQYKARIIDSDTVKPWIPGYDNGYGAGYVHEESTQIADEAFQQSVKRGDNIIVPKLGGNSVLALAEYLKYHGYTVNLYLNDVSKETSITRAASRFANEGRYLSLKMLDATPNKGYDVFVKNAENKELFDYAEWRNNDDEPKRLVWKSGDGGLNEAVRREDERRNSKLGQPVRNNEEVSSTGRLRDGVSEETGEGSELKESTDNGASSFTEVTSEQTDARNNNGYKVTSLSPYFDQSFAKQYNNWMAKGKNSSTRFNLGTLPAIYAEVAGAQYDTILLDASKITDYIQNMSSDSPHPEMTDAIVKQLPSVIQDPVLILRSHIPGRVVVVGDLAAHINRYSKSGQRTDRYLPVVVALELNAEKRGRKLGAAMVTSAYTKEASPGAMQRFMDNSPVAWVTSDTKRARSWENSYRLQLPSQSTNNESEGIITQDSENNKTQNEAYQKKLASTRSGGESAQTGIDASAYAQAGERDTRAELAEIAEGKNVKHSRGNTFDQYAGNAFMQPQDSLDSKYEKIDFSKNKLVDKDGKQYEVMWSGTNGAGFTIMNPAYAEDGISNFSTNDKRLAQSYTTHEDATPEFDMSQARDASEREVTGSKWTGVYLDDDYADKRGDAFLARMVNKHSDWSFSRKSLVEVKDGLKQWSDTVNAENDEYNNIAHTLAKDGLGVADSIVYAVEHLGSHHTASDYSSLMSLYNELVDLNKQLSPLAEDNYLGLRALHDSEDYEYKNITEHSGQGNIHLTFDDEGGFLYATAYLKQMETAVKDWLIDSGLYSKLQEGDALVKDGGTMQVGFSSLYKGQADIYTMRQADAMLPLYDDSSEGVYKMKVYAENPMTVDLDDQVWEFLDPSKFPEDIHNKLVELYGYKLGYKTREVSRAAYETGYDGVNMRGIHDSAGSYDDAADVVITYKPFQSKDYYNTNPTKNPDMRYSRGNSWGDYVKRFGKHEQNAFAQKRNIVTPKQTSPYNRVSKSVQTLKEVPSLQQYRRVVMDNQVLEEGMGVYNPATRDDMREWGHDYIGKAGGLENAMRDLTRDLRNANFKNITQLISAANQVFYELGAEAPHLINTREYNKFVAEYIATRSEWGRVGQAMQLVNDSPVGRRMYWERVVEKMNENNREAVTHGIDKFFHKNYKDIEVPEHMYKMIEQAKNEEEMNKAEYAITEYIGQNSPLTVAEALRNWRYFAMLFNPVTHIRNLLGNVTMRGGVTVKDAIAAGMENAAVRMGMMDASERTHAIVLQQDAATKEYLEKLYQQNADMIRSGGRDGFYQQVMNAKKRSPIKAIDWLMRLNTDMQTKDPRWQKLADWISLEGEDAIFLRASFKKAAAQYIQAQGIDVNNITAQQRHDIVQYATEEAQRATYRDQSKLADALNQFSKSGWAAQLFVDAVMPFKKTPINIMKRGVDYSPIGLGKGLIHLAQDAIAKSNGGELKIPASKVVDELASGLTGTALAALGFALAQAGIIRLSAGTGDKDDKFAQDTGHQGYSLEIGDLSIKIESLAPMTFPLFMGAALEKWKTQGGDSFTVSDFTDALMSISDPLMDMSFMSSLNSVLSTYEENQLKGVAVNAAQSYMSQYLPTIGAKFNNVINPVRRTTKSSAASPVGSTWDYWLRSSASKIPGGSFALEPYVKTTGEYDTIDNFGEWTLNFMNNFVSPVNVKIMDTSNVNKEISRLVASTGNTDYVPQNPSKYLMVGNDRYNMTAKQYTQYSKEYNETIYAALTAVMSTPGYDQLTDDERIQVLDKAYKSAKKSVQDKYKIIIQTDAWDK